MTKDVVSAFWRVTSNIAESPYAVIVSNPNATDRSVLTLALVHPVHSRKVV